MNQSLMILKRLCRMKKTAVKYIWFFRVKCGEYCISEVVTRLWVNFTLGTNFTAKEQRYRQISTVFLAPQLLTIDIKNVNSSNTLRAQKGTQKHNEYLPKSVNALKNSPIIFIRSPH